MSKFNGGTRRDVDGDEGSNDELILSILCGQLPVVFALSVDFVVSTVLVEDVRSSLSLRIADVLLEPAGVVGAECSSTSCNLSPSAVERKGGSCEGAGTGI